MGAGGKLPALFLPERRKYEAKKPKKAAGTLFAYLATLIYLPMIKNSGLPLSII